MPKLSQNARRSNWRRMEISVLDGTGEELAGLAGDPIDDETQPFARSRIDPAQPAPSCLGVAAIRSASCSASLPAASHSETRPWRKARQIDDANLPRDRRQMLRNLLGVPRARLVIVRQNVNVSALEILVKVRPPLFRAARIRCRDKAKRRQRVGVLLAPRQSKLYRALPAKAADDTGSSVRQARRSATPNRSSVAERIACLLSA